MRVEGRGRDRRWTGFAGIAMIVAGLLLLATVGGYYGYSSYARTTLDDLNFEVADSSSAFQPSQAFSVSSQEVPTQPSSVRRAPVSEAAPEPMAPRSESDVAETAALVSAFSASATESETAPVAEPAFREPAPAKFPSSAYTSIYPAVQIHPKFWDQPMWADSEPYQYSLGSTGPTLPDGFRSVSSADDSLTRGASANTTRITIPAIGVDSGIKELEILNLGSSRAYETPNNIVGHIPESSNPGEAGNAWFFGHLESPVRGEGNVFQQLPNIPEMLRNGDEVDIALENENGHVFLYRVSRTHVVHEDDMSLYDSENATITLVACVPRLVYDHRILVTAELVGVKDG